jgi:hypothetical protein
MNILKQIMFTVGIGIVQIHSPFRIDGNTMTYATGPRDCIRPKLKNLSFPSKCEIWRATAQEINIKEAAKSVSLSLSQFCKVLEFADQDKVDIKIPLKEGGCLILGRKSNEDSVNIKDLKTLCSKWNDEILVQIIYNKKSVILDECGTYFSVEPSITFKFTKNPTNFTYKSRLHDRFYQQFRTAFPNHPIELIGDSIHYSEIVPYTIT